MIDLYLKATTEEEMNAALVKAGLLMDFDGQLLPLAGISVDNIGPFVRWDYSVEPPVETKYPDWHTNVRAYEITDDQMKVLAPFVLEAPKEPYRVWA